MNNFKNDIVIACLAKLKNNNWSDELIISTITDLGIDKNYYEILFKSNINNVIEEYINIINNKMLNLIAENKDFESLSVSKKIFTALQIRFEIIKDDKEIIRKNTIYYSRPTNYLNASKSAWNLADIIWKSAGDTSTDFNYYSKRSILASIYSTAILYWLNEKDDDIDSAMDYIERSIKRLALFGKAKGKLKTFFK